MKAAFATLPPLSAEERKITRPAIEPLSAIHKNVVSQIGKLKTPEAATACLTSLIAWCQRSIQIIAGGTTGGAPATTKRKPAGKSGLKTRAASV